MLWYFNIYLLQSRHINKNLQNNFVFRAVKYGVLAAHVANKMAESFDDKGKNIFLC